MDYTYVASGNLVLVGGCADFRFELLFFAQYDIGDIVYDREKAHKGILEKYCIKTLRFPENHSAVYFDTLNALHNEEDLVSPQEALTIANNALAIQRQLLENFKLKQC